MKNSSEYNPIHSFSLEFNDVQISGGRMGIMLRSLPTDGPALGVIDFNDVTITDSNGPSVYIGDWSDGFIPLRMTGLSIFSSVAVNPSNGSPIIAPIKVTRIPGASTGAIADLIGGVDFGLVSIEQNTSDFVFTLQNDNATPQRHISNVSGAYSVEPNEADGIFILPSDNFTMPNLILIP